MAKTIRELITEIKSKSKGEFMGKPINEETTRDKILYGNPDVECTGIVTTIYASIDVIKKAHELGANFIISHEACFWNHGDHTDWLVDNKTFIGKKALLDEYGIVVWRDHDYIHSGVNVNGQWVDGIFYGLTQVLGWEKYRVGDGPRYTSFKFPPRTVQDLADEIMDKLHINGIKTMGNIDKKVSTLMVGGHIIGEIDNAVTKQVEENDIDVLLQMEITDFTTAIYVRDSAMLGRPKTILAAGHFNIEEAGMKWFATFLPQMIGEGYDIHFVQAGDQYIMLRHS